MFDKAPYTPGIREVMNLSQAEADRLEQSAIGPEHYLLGIIRKEDGIATEVLQKLGISAAGLAAHHRGKAS